MKITRKKNQPGRRSTTGERNVDILQSKGFYSAFGYRSARVAAGEGRTASVGSGDFHLQYDRVKLINQSREFLRDNAIYKGLIERAVAYIIHNGFKLQSNAVSTKISSKVEKLWRAWWRSPEVRGLLSGDGVAKMICREMLVAGDTGAIKTDKSLIQLIEAEQIASKSRMGDGIAKNIYGTPTKFFISPYSNTGMIDLAKGRDVAANDFLYVTNTERPSQTRGVPPCQSAFAMLHRINDVCDSEAIAWQILSKIAVSVTREDGSTFGVGESIRDPNKTSDTSGDLTIRLTELDSALIFHGEPGDKIAGVERNIPGQNFTESLRTFLRLLGLPLGLPLELILLDWTQSNYSQSRAVLEQAYTTFEGWQSLIEDFFYRPLFEWKVRQWVADGELSEREDIYEHEWIKPTFPWIDQLKETEAYGAKVDRGYATHAQVCKSLNSERDDIVNTREKEVKDAIARSAAIKKETGIDVPWQIFAGMLPPDAKPVDTKSEKEAKNKQDKNNPKKDSDQENDND